MCLRYEFLFFLRVFVSSFHFIGMYCSVFFFVQSICTHSWLISNFYKGWVEREAVKDVRGERPQFHICFQVPYTFWRREVHWVRFDLWFCWECEEVRAQVQANQGNLIFIAFTCSDQWLIFLDLDSHGTCRILLLQFIFWSYCSYAKLVLSKIYYLKLDYNGFFCKP